MGVRRARAVVVAGLLGVLGVLVGVVPASADLGHVETTAPEENHGGAPWVVLTDGRVLTAGGHAGEEFAHEHDLVDTTEIYDPATRAWTTAAPLIGGPRRGHRGAVLPDGRVLMAGGSVDASPDGSDWSAIYDPASDLWHSTGPLPGPAVLRDLLALPDGRVLTAGGVNAVFDPASETWAPLAYPSGFLGRDPLVLPDGRVLATTGAEATFTRFLYDPDTNTRSAAVGGPRRPLLSTVLPDGRVMMWGYGVTRFFDPGSRRWSSGASLRQLGSQLVALDTGRVLLRRPADDGAGSRTWSYGVHSDSWREEPAVDQPTVLPLPGGRVFGGGGPWGSRAGWRFAPRAAAQADGAPSPPQHLTVGYARGELEVEWDAPQRSGWSPVTGYELVYRAAPPHGALETTVLLPPDARSFSVPLLPGGSVRVRLSVRNLRGATDPVAADTERPDAACSIVGTDDADVLVGTDGDDVICGLGGDDIVDGGAGADLLLGGSGVDTLRFLDATRRVKVDQEARTATGLGADVVDEFEDIRGTRYDDIIDGGDALFVRGLNGDDLLRGAARLLAGGGDDLLVRRLHDPAVVLLHGGPGIDTADFGGLDAQLFLDLRTGEVAVAGDPVGEARELENVLGGDSANLLYGSDGPNLLRGTPWGEVFGRGGNDRLSANVLANGGDGFDRCTTGPSATIRNCER